MNTNTTTHRAVPTPQTDRYNYIGECECGEVFRRRTREDLTTDFRAHFGVWRNVRNHVTPGHLADV